MTKKTFIVPHDFTPVADNALEHAIATAKPLEATVFVLHVVPKEKTSAMQRLNFQGLFRVLLKRVLN